ncbi:hypothetical protein HZU67_03832 [Apis mellifera carnica]|nr:hypothetical protein HZU67_03832 [Apis mellifera carnica]
MMRDHEPVRIIITIIWRIDISIITIIIIIIIIIIKRGDTIMNNVRNDSPLRVSKFLTIEIDSWNANAGSWQLVASLYLRTERNRIGVWKYLLRWSKKICFANGAPPLR